MKTLTNRLILLAAGAAGLGTMAYGQPQMKVEIPFAFSAGGATLPAGSYLIYRQSLASMTRMVLEDIMSHHTVYAAGAYVDSYDKSSQPSAVFVCVNGNCSLSAIKMVNGTLNYARQKAARERGALVSVVSIPLTSRNGD